MAYKLVKQGNNFNSPVKYYNCDTYGDLSNINNLTFGTEAQIIDEKKTYIYNSNEVWNVKPGSSGGGGKSTFLYRYVDKGTVLTESLIPSNRIVGDAYTVLDVYQLFVWQGASWDKQNLFLNEDEHIQRKDINFYDCMYRLFASYSIEDFDLMENMPQAPLYDNLVFQKYNYTLQELQTNGTPADVGAIQKPANNKTTISIETSYKYPNIIPLIFNQSVANGVRVDWGDGSPVQTFDNIGAISVSHEQNISTDNEKYDITMEVIAGELKFGDGTNNNCILGSLNTANTAIRSSLKTVVIGSGVTEISAYAFSNCYLLEYVFIPEGIIEIAESAFSSCSFLKGVNIPTTVTTIGDRAYYACNVLSHVTSSSSLTDVGDYAFYACNSLKRLNFANPNLIMDSTIISECKTLSGEFTLNSNVTVIKSSSFRNCYALNFLNLLGDITSIADQAFESCYNMRYYDFTKCTTVPTLMSSTIFRGIGTNCKIVVPDELYDQWVLSTNWTLPYIKNQIVKESKK